MKAGWSEGGAVQHLLCSLPEGQQGGGVVRSTTVQTELVHTQGGNTDQVAILWLK